MQTRKEVDNMHAAIIRTRLGNALIALLASLALATGLTPIIGDDDSRPEPTIMPGAICPPVC